MGKAGSVVFYINSQLSNTMTMHRKLKVYFINITKNKVTNTHKHIILDNRHFYIKSMPTAIINVQLFIWLKLITFSINIYFYIFCIKNVV